MKLRARTYILALALVIQGAFADDRAVKMASITAETIRFQSGETMLHGLLYRPEGTGPFPAMIWNNGSPKPLLNSRPVSRFEELARQWVDHGYVFFIPDRRSPALDFKDGEALDDQEAMAIAVNTIKESLEQNHEDLQAAARWLKKQPGIDPNKLVMGGTSGGAIQALYEAGRSANPEVRAFVLFSPGVTQWSHSPFLRKTMTASLRNSVRPCFLIQPQNDYNLEVMAALDKEIAAKGKPYKSMVYPPHSGRTREANLFAQTGCAVWGEDVLAFMDKCLAN